MDFKAILLEAHGAAVAATADKVENMNALDCGFAWVTIPGNSGLAKFCRKAQPDPLKVSYSDHHFYGSKGYPKGWQFWCPGNFNGQSMPIHLLGARAFAAVLAKHGIAAEVGCRYD